MESATHAGDDERSDRGLWQAERVNAAAMEHVNGSAVGGYAGFLRNTAAGFGDGMEFPLRHRSPSRPDHHLPEADGIHRSADLRPQRGRTVTVRHARLFRS